MWNAPIDNVAKVVGMAPAILLPLLMLQWISCRKAKGQRYRYRVEDAMHSLMDQVWPVNSNARTGEKAKEISKFQIPNFPNFLGLVLGCIEAKFCK